MLNIYISTHFRHVFELYKEHCNYTVNELYI